MSIEHKHMKMDRLGLLMSGLCLIHCLGTPFLLLLFPVFQGLGGYHGGFHWFSALLLVPVAIVAVTQGYRHHRKKIVPLLAGLGAALVIAGALTPLLIDEHHHDHNVWFSKDIIISMIGSVCLIVCHSLNIYFCRQGNVKATCHNH